MAFVRNILQNYGTVVKRESGTGFSHSLPARHLCVVSAGMPVVTVGETDRLEHGRVYHRC